MKAFVLMLLLICPVVMFSQQEQATDSVLKVLATAKEDTNKVLLLITIGQNIENNKPEEAKGYYREAKNLSEKKFSPQRRKVAKLPQRKPLPR